MDKFIRAREELYSYLYDKFLADDGPYCGDKEIDGLCQTNRFMNRAVLFAKDMGHVKSNRFGGLRLTGVGVLYAEKEYGERDGD